MGVLDAIKMTQENWEIFHQQNLGVHKVIQSRIQGLKHDLEILTMVKIDSVMDFMIKFMHTIYRIGERR